MNKNCRSAYKPFDRKSLMLPSSIRIRCDLHVEQFGEFHFGKVKEHGKFSGLVFKIIAA